MNSQHTYLSALGLRNWQSRLQTSDQAVITPAMDWEKLQAQVSVCTLCDLHQSRTHTVFGSGNPHASLMIIGEAPGFYEDKAGLPFVGRAGQLLTAMLKSVGMKREEVYIANILKCRPPNNRDPKPEEVALCTRYLAAQIQHIQPKLLLAVGRIAAHYLLDTKKSLELLRQQTHAYAATETPILITYHPAYLLRNPIDKRNAYQDLMRVVNKLKIL